MKKVAEFSTEVLVIGGGMAGMMAALAAKSRGKKVLIVSKAPVGRSGNTLVSGGGISSVTADEGNGIDQFVQDLSKSGKGLNSPLLTRKLAQESAVMLHKLEQFGVRLIRQDGALKRRRPPGHSIARNIPTEWGSLSYLNRGLSFSLPLFESLKSQQVPMMEGISVCKLVTDDSGVVGAVGIDSRDTEFHFQAPNIVLATGGGGYIYSRTNNTRDISADGLAMAMEIGCVLQDMEQIQFYPTMMFSPLKVTVSNPLFGVGAVLRNAAGERFMGKYNSSGDMATRDSMARGIFQEVEAGKGVDGCVFFDCTAIPKHILMDQYSDFCKFIGSAGLDPTKDLLKVSPCVHYFLGGIVIDEQARTNVCGLYAAGEICGGIHGANRLSGAALMETCVFGWQAGISAASGNRQNNSAITFPNFEVISNADGIQASTLDKISELRNAMWKNAGLIRSEKGLREMEEWLDKSREELETKLPSRKGQELQNMLKVSRAIVSSALLRKESRGAHYRSDYPQQSAEFDSNVLCWQDGNKIQVKLAAQGLAENNS